jgi:transposase
MHEEGFSFREIARRLNQIHSSWSEEGIQHRRPGNGRPRRMNEREDQRLS